MKKNKFIVFVLGLAFIIGIAGCTPNDTGIDNARNRNLSTQTRINDNRGDNLNDGFLGMNDGINNGINDGLNNTNMGMNNRNNFNDDFLEGNGFDDNLNNGMTRPNNNTSTGKSTMTNANNLAKKIAALPEVSKASVVLTSDTAIVGCNLRGNTQGTMTNDLKQKIEKMVKDEDTNIKNVSITTDPDLFTRIQTMSTNVGNGHPIEGLGEEIQDLIRRITSPITTR